jgi:hypothetical protein
VNHYIFRKITDQIATLEQLTGCRWWEDKFAAEQVELLTLGVLRYFKPRGAGSTPSKLRHMHPPLGTQLAFRALVEAQGAIAGRRLERAVTAPHSRSARLGAAKLEREERTDFLRELEKKA